jgi:methionyl-tRNA synthetase
MLKWNTKNRPENIMNSKSSTKFYVTTAIPYVNAKPHIGFALELVQTDVLARYHRLKGDDVYFLTGSDENSLKNVQAACKEGISIKALVDKYSKEFKDLKRLLNLTNDDFIRTSEKRHFEGAEKLWQSCKKEDIYKKKYKGLYCVGCERYYSKEELIDSKCPEHKTVPEEIEEENYFFRLSNYGSKLIELIKSNKIEIIPETRKNEALSFLEMGLEDISISRSKERAGNWGVPVPNDPSQVMYVWFDALSNYITALNYGGDEKLFKKYWPANIQVIGKGILRFHAIYFPAMLLSAGFSENELPKRIFVHGYVSINGEKISKSLGNVISPKEVIDKYGVDALRYYLLKEISPFKDGDFSFEKMEEIYNNELANDLGNLVNRVVSMADRYKIGLKVKGLRLKVKTDNSKLNKFIDNFQFDEALKLIWKDVRDANNYIEQNKPWELASAKALKEQNRKKLEEIFEHLFEMLYAICYMLHIFLPETAEKIQSQLKSLKPDPLFPRIK